MQPITIIKGGGAYWKRKKNSSAVLPEYLSARYLKPFITNELKEKLSSAVLYTSVSGTKANGIDATVLADICDVFKSLNHYISILSNLV